MKDVSTNPHITTPTKKERKISKWIIYALAGALTIGIFAMVVHFVGGSAHKETIDDEPNYCLDHSSEEITGTINGHEWVDLGLPSGVKWSTCNVGADVMVDPGVYYAWGETLPKETYSTTNSLTHRNDFSSLKKKGIINDSGNLTEKYDVATVIWGDPWRMPTINDFQELIKLCDWEFTSVNEVNGYMVTGPNQRQIFLPASAYQDETTIENFGEFGDYWSSSIVKESSGASCSLGYSSKSYGRRHYARYVGRTIRPVTD